MDIDKLIEKDKIIDIANSLFIYTDEMNWAKVKEVFADEVLFDMTSLSGGEPALLTPQQIIDGWDASLRKLKARHHQAGNFRIDVAGKEADLFCYGIAFHHLPNPTNNNTRIFVGSYDLHFVKKEKGWKIDKFKFILKFIDGNKDLEAYVNS
ncbi:MAG: nuclear transport factor 2 family protein [Methanotrichaceae archaeon]